MLLLNILLSLLWFLLQSFSCSLLFKNLGTVRFYLFFYPKKDFYFKINAVLSIHQIILKRIIIICTKMLSNILFSILIIIIRNYS